MKFPFLFRYRTVLFSIGTVVTVLAIGATYAINILSEGYRVNSNTTTMIDATAVGGDCKSIVTPNDGKDRFIPTKTLVEWNAFKSAAPGLWLTLNACGTIYPGCDTPDITLANGQVWAACNAGATTAYNGQAYPSFVAPTAGQKAYMGALYQWGRNDDVTAIGTPTPTLAPTGTLAGGVGHSNLITKGTFPYNWIVTSNNNLWGGGSTSLGFGTFIEQSAWNKIAMAGPCASGYHVPTQAEWWSALNAVHPGLTNTASSQNDTALATAIKLPLSGVREGLTAAYWSQGTYGYYWTSSAGNNMEFTVNQVNPAGSIFPLHALSVRCLRNPPVTTYPGCDTDDITLANGQVWAACNAGATVTYTGQAYPADTVPTAGQKAYMGGYFQWGRNDDVTANTNTPTLAPAGTLAGGVGHSNFITTEDIDWILTPNDNLWGGGTTTNTSGTFASMTAGNQVTMKGLCAPGYHVPTQKEWCDAVVSVTSNAWCDAVAHNDTTFRSTLKFPLSGVRFNDTGTYYWQGWWGYYWASSPTGTEGYSVLLSATQVTPAANMTRANGFSVRCLKDPPVTTYPGCDTPDINLANGQVWAACNVGAAYAYTGAVITDCTGSVNDCAIALRPTIGSYFQWGRNDDVTAQGTPTSTRAPAGTLAWGVGHSNFITNEISPYDWIVTQNGNLWGGGSTSLGSGTFAGQSAWNQDAMKGSCAFGYHVPTQAEWWSTVNILNGALTNTTSWQNDTVVRTALKLPLAGFRSFAAGYNTQGTLGYYWASSPTGTYEYHINFSATQVNPANYNYRAHAYSLRCLKN